MPAANKLHILIADDDDDDQLLLRLAFEETFPDLILHFVEDGQEVMDYLLCRAAYPTIEFAPRPLLILLDLNMPRKNGYEVLEEIKAHPDLKRIPVVIFTTSMEQIDVQKSYHMGANSLIRKPYTFTELLETVKVVYEFWVVTCQTSAK